MGSSDPLVHIEAATLPGGDTNQDRYAYGDGWAFVLDGASSFSSTTPVHDGGWYAERLKKALVRRLRGAGSAVPSDDVVARSIEAAASAHDSHTQGSCPTSTIALVRWDSQWVELYVLGDSACVLVDSAGTVSFLTDDRIKRTGASIRTQAYERLKDGSGFDETHQQLMAQLQTEQKRNRNQTGGYWIAGDLADAAMYGLRYETARSAVATLLLATDGISAVGGIEALQLAADPGSNLTQALRQAHLLEEWDPQAKHRPRSKVHDDKTAVRVEFERPSALLTG